MAWQSPYRGEEDFPVQLSPRAREMVSRGTMLVVGIVLAYVSVRGLHGMMTLASAAATQPSYGSSTSGMHSNGGARLFTMAGASLVGLGLLSGLTIAAAVLPVSVMQYLFEQWNTPPVTGDRSPETDDYYRPILPRRRPWWW